MILCNCRIKQHIFSEADTCSNFSLAASPTRKMKNDSPATADGMPGDKQQSHDATAVSERSIDITTTNIHQPLATADGSLGLSTPNKTERTHDVNNIIARHTTAAGSPRRVVGLSSYKRRRLASEDDANITIDMPTTASALGSTVGSAIKLSYQPRHVSATSSDESDDDEDDDDPIDQELLQMRQESILKKIKRLNGEDEDNQLIHTSAFAKLYEYVEGAWKYLGAGHVKVRLFVHIM